MSKKKQMLAILIIVITLVISIVGATYAYFSVTITGNDNASNIITNAGTLSLFYEYGGIINTSEAIPGWTDTAEFRVINTGTVTINYNIIWSELLNEIQNGDLVYDIQRATVASEKEYQMLLEGNINIEELNITTILNETPVPITAGNILTDVQIQPGKIHVYAIRTTFLNKSTDQSINQGKSFAGKIEVTTEYIEEPATLMLSEKHSYLDLQPFLGSPIRRNEIEEMEFINHKNIPASAIGSWDVSNTQDGSIMAWYEPVGTNGRYKVTIGSNEEIYANPDSSSLFDSLNNLLSLSLNNFNTKHTYNMEFMFSGTGYNNPSLTIDFGNKFNTSHALQIYGMFCATGGNNNPNFGLNLLENIDISHITNKNNIFMCLGS